MVGRKGQSILEYVIILTAVVGAILIAAGLMRTKLGESFNQTGTLIANATGKLANLTQ